MLDTYDRETRTKTAVLQNALDVVETEQLNGVSQLTFSLPADDPKNRCCIPFHLARWRDGAFYRILDHVSRKNGDTPLLEYECEHVIASLIDDVIFGHLQLDNLTTRQVIERILAMQTVKNWTLGDCDFERRFSYNWSNENLLTALFSVPNRFDTDYQWVFDTSAHPWTVHLRMLDQTRHPEYYVREGRNLISAESSSKGRDICTRIYPLGYGEGVNQLTIKDVNSGIPYLDAPPEAIKKYGLITRIWEDCRFEISQSLYDRAKVLLAGYGKPYERHTIQAADLDKMTGQAIDRAEAGKIVWYEGFTSYITRVERHLTEVGQDTLEIANTPEDIAGSIADLADRQRINSVYAQGATNIYAQSFSDNANPQYPAVMQFYIPAEAKQINKVLLTWRTEAFRAYSVSAESTPTTSRSTDGGGQSTQTSSSGGATTSSSGGGGVTSSQSGGGGITSSGPSSRETTSVTEGSLPVASATSAQRGLLGGMLAQISPGEVSKMDHYHYGDPAHIERHSHYMDHTHTISSPSHTHNVAFSPHTHSIGSHTHSVTIPQHSHTFTIPGHTHKIEYGIYQGPRANAVTIRVDGRAVPLNGNVSEMDVVNYLSVDNSGKIQRGAYHTIEIVPNALSRISATVTVQLFIQSYGGGNY